MLILHFLPEWFFHAVLFAGVSGLVISYILGYIPFVGMYKYPIRVVSIAAIVATIWFEGGLSNERVWQKRVKELEAKIAVAEAKSKEENTKIQALVAENINKAKDVANANKKLLQGQVGKELDAKCVIPEPTIRVLNSSARGEKVSGSPADTNAGTGTTENSRNKPTQ
jgi:hypothetical protein